MRRLTNEFINTHLKARRAASSTFDLRRVGSGLRHRRDHKTHASRVFTVIWVHLCFLWIITNTRDRLPKPLGTGGDEQTLQQTYFRRSARCVQSFDDSLDFAIRITYRISLRSSSLWEPRHPLLKVLVTFCLVRTTVGLHRFHPLT